MTRCTVIFGSWSPKMTNSEIIVLSQYLTCFWVPVISHYVMVYVCVTVLCDVKFFCMKLILKWFFLFCSILFYWKSKIGWFDDIKLILQSLFISANTIKVYFYESGHMTSLSVTFSQPLGAVKRNAFISFRKLVLTALVQKIIDS